MTVVSALYVYPIKACRGVRVTEWPVVARGFEADRRWMIVDETGRFVSQREEPKLALVDTAFVGDSFRVAAPGLQPLTLPRVYEVPETRAVQVWSDVTLGCVHAEGSEWFSRYVDVPLQLVYMPDSYHRHVNPARARPTDIVGFADGYPFLLISEASLEDLNARMEAPIPMERFRPNIVVSGTEPYAEDHFDEVRLGDIAFRGVKRCDRCVVTTIDIATGEPSREPLRTLATYRRWDSKVWFGMNMIHDGPGVLRVGDAVQAQP